MRSAICRYPCPRVVESGTAKKASLPSVHSTTPLNHSSSSAPPPGLDVGVRLRYCPSALRDGPRTRSTQPRITQALQHFALRLTQVRLRQLLVTTFTHVLHLDTHALIRLGIRSLLGQGCGGLLLRWRFPLR